MFIRDHGRRIFGCALAAGLMLLFVALQGGVYAHDRENHGRESALRGVMPAVAAWVDIMPDACPNRLTDNNFWMEDGRIVDSVPVDAAYKFTPGTARTPRLVKVVVVGSDLVDVHQIDVNRLCLAGIGCVKAVIADCASPPVHTSQDINNGPFPCCGCTPDGYDDLVITVEKYRLFKACGDAGHCQEVALILNGWFMDGTPFVGVDAVTVIRTCDQVVVSNTLKSPIVDVSPCYPNPFNPATSFSIRFDRPTDYRVDIYNVTGQRVRTMAGHAPAGSTRITWDGTNQNGAQVGAGVYLYRVTAGPAEARGKMLMLK